MLHIPETLFSFHTSLYIRPDFQLNRTRAPAYRAVPVRGTSAARLTLKFEQPWLGRSNEIQPWARNCHRGEFILLCLRQRSAVLSAEFLRLSLSSVMVISTQKAAYERVLKKSLVTCYYFNLCNLSSSSSRGTSISSCFTDRFK